MKVSLKWLRDFIQIKLPLKDLAYKLTMSGTEVGDIEHIGESWDKIVVGEIIGVQPHPNADRLTLVTVDLAKEQVIVVCGAPNVRVGDKVPFARVGATLIDSHTGKTMKLTPAKIRGVVSEGMACSERELGISESHEGLMILPPTAPVGVGLTEYLGDAVLDLDVTPNRPDCLSIIGIAREVAALTRQNVQVPEVQYAEDGPEAGEMISIEIKDPDLCSRYCASIIEGVRIVPSPPWMQQRLLACGMRPINNIVDVTNYVMLEYGQPLHAFDYDQIGGRSIVVRRAQAGERMTTLDGVERALDPSMLVIADKEIPVALAGVMGGADSEVIEITKTILLESANFHPASIRRTSTKLKLRSEASLRFERGISPELTVPALRRATQLMIETGGGKVAKGIVDVYPGKKPVKQIQLAPATVRNVLGIDMKMEQVTDILGSLGFEYTTNGGPELQITVPYWRMDVNQPVDVVEELARVVGYDFIPTTMLSGRLPGQITDRLVELREKLRLIMVGSGYQEVITYSLVGRDKLARFGKAEDAIRIANPLSIEQEYLRTSLLPNLVQHLSSNRKYESNGIRLFELGRIYLPREGDLPEEKETLAAALSGSRTEKSWFGNGGVLDYFDIKGLLDLLSDRLEVRFDYRPATEPYLNPGRSAELLIEGEPAGILGEAHPKLAEQLDMAGQPLVLLEMDLAKVLGNMRPGSRYHSISRFPESVRDIAVVVDQGVPQLKVKEAILDSPLVRNVDLFDVYAGEKVPEGKKSLAYRIVFQSETHTLTDAEVDEVESGIVSRLGKEFGATLRR